MQVDKGSDLMKVDKGSDLMQVDKGSDLMFLEFFHKIITNQYKSVEEGFNDWLSYCKSKGINVPDDID